MSKIKKLMIGLGAGVVALGLLSGCGNQQASQNNNQQQSQQQNKNSNNGNNGAPSQVAKNGKTNMENDEDHQFNTTKVPTMNYQAYNKASGEIQSESPVDYYASPADAYKAGKTGGDTGEGVYKSKGALTDESLHILGVYKANGKKVVYKAVKTKNVNDPNNSFGKNVDVGNSFYLPVSDNISVSSPNHPSHNLFD